MSPALKLKKEDVTVLRVYLCLPYDARSEEKLFP